ncbi:signal peptidase I [Lactococcus laudensis]|uniref:signal peptidase I n=1 Tax=Pseudolactococcus laudensis TaxID=1494461 RepID=UPI002FC8856C
MIKKRWLFCLIGLVLFVTICFMGLLLSRIFIWQPIVVEGHAMEPNFVANQHLIIIKKTQIERFDIVVAKKQGSGNILKRVIGLPGDTISYDKDTLTLNGQVVDEPYLKDYQEKFATDKLQSTHHDNSFFQNIAKKAQAFTLSADNKATFTIHVPEGQYFILGDNRLVSQDSRQLGTFTKKELIGKIKFRAP